LKRYVSFDGWPLFSAWRLDAYVTFLVPFCIVVDEDWADTPGHKGAVAVFASRPMLDGPREEWRCSLRLLAQPGGLPARRRKDPEGWSGRFFTPVTPMR